MFLVAVRLIIERGELSKLVATLLYCCCEGWALSTDLLDLANSLLTFFAGANEKEAAELQNLLGLDDGNAGFEEQLGLFNKCAP
jgi:hypothetical protein